MLDFRGWLQVHVVLMHSVFRGGIGINHRHLMGFKRDDGSAEVRNRSFLGTRFPSSHTFRHRTLSAVRFMLVGVRGLRRSHGKSWLGKRLVTLDLKTRLSVVSGERAAAFSSRLFSAFPRAFNVVGKFATWRENVASCVVRWYLRLDFSNKLNTKLIALGLCGYDKVRNKCQNFSRRECYHSYLKEIYMKDTIRRQRSCLHGCEVLTPHVKFDAGCNPPVAKENNASRNNGSSNASSRNQRGGENASTAPLLPP